MKLHHCLNCGKTFTRQFRVTGGHVKYCSDQCRLSADRKRRRARRQRRRSQPLATVCECFDCGVTFTPDQDTLTEHGEHFWQVVESGIPCRECGEGQAVLDGLFCSQDCWTLHWNREIPHDPAKPLTADQIAWSDRFAETLLPLVRG